MREMWFRNPEKWTDVLASLNSTKVVWHRGILIKRRIDPVAHANLHFAAGIPWRVMSMGAQGAVEWTPQSKDFHSPVACYPVWQYGEDLTVLETLLSENIADSATNHADPLLDKEYWPQAGQEHRVVIGSYPALNSWAGRRFLVEIQDLQAAYPDAILHLFSASTIAPIMGVRAGDFDPYTPAAAGRIMLPNGRTIAKDVFPAHRQWINLLGTSVTDLIASKDERLQFNIKSAEYAAVNWDTPEIFSTRFRPGHRVDELPEPSMLLAKPNRLPYRGSPQEGDKISCDACTLSINCKYFRVGSVCTLPSSDTAELAVTFKTRDSNKIIASLGEVLDVQAQRAQVGMEYENEAGQLDPEVSRVLKALFDGGVRLAKLVDPTLAAAGAARIGIQVNATHGTVTASNPQALMASLVKELEARGVPRDEITPEMIVGLTEESRIIDVVALDPGR